jgi:hypothetical protein
MTSLLENRIDKRESHGDPSSVAMYVSTSLEQWLASDPAIFARDVQIDDTAYRRLDPGYFAWLRSKMTIAKSAVRAGKLSASQFDDLRAKFNAMQDWAAVTFGEPPLLEAIRTLDARTYAPPVAEPWTEHRQWPVASPSGSDKGFFTQTVSDHAIRCVDVIRDQALALGWTHQALYQSRGRLRFPFGDDYGLVCFLDAGDRIGTLAADSIEIIGPPPQRFRSHCYNPDFEHSWKCRRP